MPQQSLLCWLQHAPAAIGEQLVQDLVVHLEEPDGGVGEGLRKLKRGLGGEFGRRHNRAGKPGVCLLERERRISFAWGVEVGS